MAIVVTLGVANPAAAGVFKGRGAKPATTAPAKKPAVEKTAAEKPEKAAPAKKAPAKAPAKKTQARAPAKKGPKSTVATNGRPDDLTPDKPTKKPKDAVTVVEEDVEDDVIIRDIDD